MAFDHERMQVYRDALGAARHCHGVVRRIRSGQPALADQLHRASTSIVLNIAEGAGEFSRAEKARFYRIARRSASESAATLDVLVALGLMSANERDPLADLLASIARMLTGLARTFGREGPGAGESP